MADSTVVWFSRSSFSSHRIRRRCSTEENDVILLIIAAFSSLLEAGPCIQPCTSIVIHCTLLYFVDNIIDLRNALAAQATRIVMCIVDRTTLYSVSSHEDLQSTQGLRRDDQRRVEPRSGVILAPVHGKITTPTSWSARKRCLSNLGY